MYEMDKNKPFYSGLIMLNIFFWYPLKTKYHQKILFFTISGILRLLSFICACGTLAHAVLQVKNSTGIDISEDIGDITGFAGCTIPCMTFMIYHTKWSNFFIDLEDFKHFGKPPKYDKVVKRGNLISFIGQCYSVPGMFWYCFVSYLKIPECKEINARKGLKEVCGIVNPTWLPETAAEGTTFIVVYILQAIGIFAYLPSSIACCLLVWEAVEVIITRINYLKGLFLHMFDSNDRKECVRRLHYCISYHQDIIRISNELMVLVKSTVGSLFLVAAFIIGSLGSQLIKESTPKVVTFVSGYVMALFFICHAGQRLIDESLDVATYVYNSKWYDMDARIKRDVAFVLKRCQKPLSLALFSSMGSAGYELFAVMIRTSYSYLTLLNYMV